MDEILRVLVTISMITPMVYTDVKGRYAMQDMMVVSISVAFCFLAYDMLTGGFDIISVGYVMGVAMVIAMGIMWRVGIVGFADVIVSGVIVMMNPQINGFPIGIGVIITGYVASAIYVMLFSLYRNMSDVVAGKKHTTNILFTHFKRRGDKFCTSMGLMKLGGFEGDDLVTKNGSKVFVEDDAYGMEVTKTVPMLLAFMASFVAISILAFLGLGSFILEFPDLGM